MAHSEAEPGDGPDLAVLRALLDRVTHPEPGDDGQLDAALAAGSADDQIDGDPGPALDHERVRALDPLNLDRALSQLPDANRTQDTGSVRRWLVEATDRVSSDLDVEAATAALRDAGMLLGSLRRAGVDPLSVGERVEPLLVAWGQTTGMVPRDTVVHYGLWNPTGVRERRYIDRGAQEGALIDSVRLSARLLPLAGAALDLAWHHDLTTEAGLAGLRLVRDAVQEFADMFNHTRTAVSPEFFARDLRPFFDPVTVDGTLYSGPAAAFIPLYLVDELLWGGGAELSVMHHEALVYARPLWRRAQARVAPHQPVAPELEQRVTNQDRGADEALRVTDQAVRALLRFRGQHVTTARQAYAASHYEHGSGGYSPDQLRTVTDEERAAATVLGRFRRHDDGARE